MTKFDSKEANDRALEFFPQWMDIRKRPKRSVGGKYLSSITDENDEFEQAFEKFKDGFFLKRFSGHENEILSFVYIAHIGSLESIIPIGGIKITTDARTFLDAPDMFALYQDGYAILKNEGTGFFEYEHDGFQHKLKLEKTPLWNVFDEFALFSGLERYPGESNLELSNRIYAAYRRPQSPTEDGLRNAIINAVMNYDNLDPEDILFERPNSSNMFASCADGENIYEKLSTLNKDIARKKVWNKSYWENDFKKIKYIDNPWDTNLEIYQKGVGQKDDLKVKLSGQDNSDATTDISIMGYKASSKLINDYIRKQGIRKDISLTLQRYRDELKERMVEYRLDATPAKEINPAMVTIIAKQKLEGKIRCNLEDIVEDPGVITEVVHGDIEKDTPYTLEFTASDPFGTMKINKCDAIFTDGSVSSLLKEYGTYKYVNGVLQNTDIRMHVDRISQLNEAQNFENVLGGGFSVGSKGSSASLIVDVSNMQGMPVTIPIECQQSNYTNDSNFVTYDGSFSLINAQELLASGTDSESKIVIEMDCASIHYDLGGEQGCATIEFELDGELDADKSGFFTKACSFDYDFQKNRHIKVTITKAGMYPLAVKNIMAARYNVEMSVAHGTFIQTAKYIKLPQAANNQLKIKIDSLSGYSPIIKYIHVGPSLEHAVYRIKDFSIKKPGRLDIDTNCKIKLYKGKTLLNNNYSTKKSYVNRTDYNATLIVNTNNFLSIDKSSKSIEVIAYHGSKRGAITLKPGEELETIDIVGQMFQTKMSCSLSDLLDIQPNEKLYIAGNANGFISLDENGKTAIIRCEKNMFPAETDYVEFDNVPNGAKAVFAINSAQDIENITNTFNSGAFEYAYIKAADVKDYVAYNSVKMLQSPMSNVNIVNTFSPAIDLNTLLFYRIANVKTSEAKASARFTYINGNNTEYRDWALGANHNGICVEYDFSFGNTDSYKLDIDSINEAFSLSNSIKLEDQYEKNGVSYELARYIVTPPDDMKIAYKNEMSQEKVFVAEDGFNKLWYSNIYEILSVEIDGTTLTPTNYRLIEDAGIIIWDNMADKIGSEATITYRFARPDSIEFKDISSLYELVGYSVDAYEPLLDRPMIIKNMHHGDSKDILIDGIKPDRLIIKCSNESFLATVDKSRVTVQKQPNTVNVMVHSGYYYDKDKEYYFFEHDFEEDVNQMKNVDLDHIRKNSGTLTGIQESGNYLLDTNMSGGQFLEKTCYIDCHDHQERIKGISDFRTITACDSYQQWNDFNMDIKLVPGLNGLGIQFHSTGIGAYAILNISDKIKEGSYLTFYADASLRTRIMREVYADGDPMRKSVYCEEIGECSITDKIRSYKFEHKDERRLYLCISGDGIIDDLIIREGIDEDPGLENIHMKNISSIGFDIKEEIPKATKVPIIFNPEGNWLDGLEINDGGILETGSTVDWGITKIADFSNVTERIICNKVNQRKGAFYTGSERGRIKTPWTYIPNISSANALFIKINDVLLNSLKDFDVRVYTAKDMYGHDMKEIAHHRKTNLALIPVEAASIYVQIVVEMPPVRVINSIEIYARYVEKPNHALHVSESTQGTMISKIYDLVTEGNYRLRRIDADSVTHPENIHVMIRGLRQDDEHAVWTQWYPCELDHDLNCVSSHDFYEYRFFQFKIEISDMDASTKISNFVFEVV